jgi:hypothetical protein
LLLSAAVEKAAHEAVHCHLAAAIRRRRAGHRSGRAIEAPAALRADRSEMT